MAMRPDENTEDKLSPEALSELEEAIAVACADRRRAGWTIRPGVTFSEESRECCPIGALFGCSQAIGASFGPVTMAESHIGPIFVRAFVAGFDGRRDLPAYTRSGRRGFEMGRRFRDRLVQGDL